jgi:hypothetical protein
MYNVPTGSKETVFNWIRHNWAKGYCYSDPQLGCSSTHVFSSINSVSLWPGASFQNRSYWDSSALFWIPENTACPPLNFRDLFVGEEGVDPDIIIAWSAIYQKWNNDLDFLQPYLLCMMMMMIQPDFCILLKTSIATRNRVPIYF